MYVLRWIGLEEVLWISGSVIEMNFCPKVLTKCKTEAEIVLSTKEIACFPWILNINLKNCLILEDSSELLEE